MVRKYEICGLEGNTWLQLGESDDLQSIQVVISTASIQQQRMITSIITLNKDMWEDLMSLHYKLTVNRPIKGEELTEEEGE